MIVSPTENKKRHESYNVLHLSQTILYGRRKVFFGVKQCRFNNGARAKQHSLRVKRHVK